MNNVPCELKDVIILSGLSGSGKTTIGREFVNRHENFVLIDLDSHYKEIKPLTTLSSGEEVSNWDTVEAINWKSLNNAVNAARKSYKVLLTGFAPWSEYLDFPVKTHIHLSYGRDPKIVLSRVIASRRESKSFVTEEKKKKDVLMVLEVVHPFYLETMKHVKINYILDTYKGDKRKTISELIKELEHLVE
jgi:uridine kinase